MSRPLLPKLTVVTGANAVGLKYDPPFGPMPWPPRIATFGITCSAVCELPGEFKEVPDEATVNGNPLSRLRIPLICQPPAIFAPTPFASQCCPLPNGSV